MERMLRVHRVKFAGPGFSSMSPERRKKARRSGNLVQPNYKYKYKYHISGVE